MKIRSSILAITTLAVLAAVITSTSTGQLNRSGPESRRNPQPAAQQHQPR